MTDIDCWKPDKVSFVPLYEQIKEFIKQKIIQGEWSAGSKIPTQRQLAKQFEVNRSTIVTAIEELVAEGILEGNRKGGTVVRSNIWALLSKNPPPDWKSYIKAGTYHPNFDTVQQINLFEHTKEMIRLNAGELSPALFPEKIMKTVINNMNDRIKSLGYEHPKGYYELRKEISSYLKTTGINASSEQIVIVSGALQALHLISTGILYKGSTVLTENPSYLYTINVFQSASMKLYGIPLDNHGIQMEKIPKYKKQTNASLLYTIPSFQNPTGICMSNEKKKELLSVCEKERLPILEDDTYRELYFGNEAPKPIKAFDNNDIVLFVGSMSKQLLPGLRIGWVVGHESVIERLADIKMQIDYGSSTLSQTAVAELLSSGLFFDYLENIRKELLIRRNIALESLNKYFADIADWKIPQGGFYIWLTLKNPLSMEKLFNNCVQKGILISPGNLYQHLSKQSIRISYSYASYKDLEYGLKILSETIRVMYKEDFDSI